MASYSNPRLEDLFTACVKCGDTDMEGKENPYLGLQEFRTLCKKIGISDGDSDVIFTDLDHDGDGRIDFEDFSHGFRDFLIPGSRRGSLQVPLMDSSTAQQLIEMEQKHASARNAWKQFTNNVGTTSIKSFLHSSGEHLQDIVEELRNEEPQVSTKLEKALSSLISDVQNLHEEYKSLETSFRKEREAHAAQLAALGEELDQQLAKTEAKVKDEARQEAQKQMDCERKKITMEMESQMADLSSQMKTFQKVEEWLAEEETREKKVKSHEDFARLHEAENENRKLRSALVEAQMKATLLQSQLSEKRNEYVDLYHQLHSEKVASTEYKNQCDLMQNHLSILSEANRVLSDANDCFSNISLSPSPCTLHDELHGQCSSKTNSLDRSSHLKLPSEPNNCDTDSGQETLLEELRSQGDGSPLPSGLWSSGNTPGSGTGSVTPDNEVDVPLNPSSLELMEKPSKIFRPDLSSSSPPLLPSSPGGGGGASAKNVLPARTFKVILAGDAAVGKTTFIERVCNGYFVSNLSSTIGVDFRVKTVEMEGKCVAIQLWDTAGQERFRSLTKSYFRRADGVILMYDVTNERTFVSIRHWIQNVEEGAGRKLPIVLCGNKIDLRDELYKGTSCVSTEAGQKVGRQCGALFAETSPKTGQNISQVLLMLAKEMSLMEDAELKNYLQLDVVLEDDESKNKKRGCCSSGGSTSNTNNVNNNNSRIAANSKTTTSLNSTYKNFNES